jgi:hypothetical protein
MPRARRTPMLQPTTLALSKTQSIRLGAHSMSRSDVHIDGCAAVRISPKSSSGRTERQPACIRQSPPSIPARRVRGSPVIRVIPIRSTVGVFGAPAIGRAWARLLGGLAGNGVKGFTLTRADRRSWRARSPTSWGGSCRAAAVRSRCRGALPDMLRHSLQGWRRRRCRWWLEPSWHR